MPVLPELGGTSSFLINGEKFLRAHLFSLAKLETTADGIAKNSLSTESAYNPSLKHSFGSEGKVRQYLNAK